MPACLKNNGNLRFSREAYMKKPAFLYPLLHHQTKSNRETTLILFFFIYLFFYASAA